MSKLLVTDYDGTFIRSDCTVSTEQLNTVNDFILKGNIFAVITGRMTASILPLVKDLGLKGLVAAFNGGEVTEIETGKHIYTNYIDCATAVEVFKIIESKNAYCHGYSKEEYFCPYRSSYTDFYENITYVKANVLNQKLSEYFYNNNLDTKKILVMDDAHVLDGVMPLLTPFKNRLNIVRSNAYQIEITDPKSTKATALEYLAKIYGIDKANTYSIGDGGNDVSMIISAGIGFAVNNAETSLKEVADIVLPCTNNQNAVKYIIDNYLTK